MGGHWTGTTDTMGWMGMTGSMGTMGLTGTMEWNMSDLVWTEHV